MGQATQIAPSAGMEAMAEWKPLSNFAREARKDNEDVRGHETIMKLDAIRQFPEQHFETIGCAQDPHCHIFFDTQLLVERSPAVSSHRSAVSAVFQRLDQLRKHLVDITDNPKVGNRENGSIGVLVDGDDGSGVLHADKVLHGA